MTRIYEKTHFDLIIKNTPVTVFILIFSRLVKLIWKILISISIVFILGFGSLFFVNELFSSPIGPDEEEVFFNQQFDPDKKLILLIGSSHIAHLNMDKIITKISLNSSEYEIYNLPKNHDTPKMRYDMINKIISLEPEIIFYGISYREFESTKLLDENSNFKFDLKKITYETFSNFDFVNPQLIIKK